MKKQNIAEEVIDCCIEQDFNPDIVLCGVRETYEVGKLEGFRKGFGIGFGLWFVGLSTLAIAIEIGKRRKKKNRKEPLVIDIDDPEDPKKGIHQYFYEEV